MNKRKVGCTISDDGKTPTVEFATAMADNGIGVSELGVGNKNKSLGIKFKENTKEWSGFLATLVFKEI